MIKGQCVSNRDEFRHKGTWPDMFVGVPRIGDSVASSSGYRLRIVQITHGQRQPISSRYSPISTLEPYIQIELNK